MTTTELHLIDLSGLAHAIYHVSGNEPDPNYISTQLVARVRALASGHPHAAICCDSGKSFRHDLAPDYKANRNTENRAVIAHQMKLACETLAADGFPIWSVKGAEADDIIASATKHALAIPDTSVLIASADKDLLQLVGDRVAMKKTSDGNTMDAAAVREKFKVDPSQMLDYLCLVGDASDNVKGANGIGGVRAASLLGKYGSIDGIYRAIDGGATPDIAPSQRTSLQEFRERWPLVRQLIALKDDVDIPFEEVAVERTAKAMEADEHEIMGPDSFGGEDYPSDGSLPMPQSTVRELPPQAAAAALGAATARVSEGIKANESMVRAADILPPVADFTLQLEPRTPDEAARLAGHLFASKLFSSYGTWQGVLSTIIAGRELGLPAMASLRAFHIIENRPSMSADTIAARVLASGKARYFKPTKRTDTAAAFKTLRVGEEEEPFELVYTIEEARQAWKKDQRAWDASGWGKNPADMLVARAKSKLARLIYPDVVGGLYAVEEME